MLGLPQRQAAAPAAVQPSVSRCFPRMSLARPHRPAHRRAGNAPQRRSCNLMAAAGWNDAPNTVIILAKRTPPVSFCPAHRCVLAPMGAGEKSPTPLSPPPPKKKEILGPLFLALK